MEEDLSGLLSGWPYDPENQVRKIIGLDGSEKIQVRLPLGIEQYEVNGRPDGLRPKGFESLLEYHRDRLKKHVAATGSDEGFSMSHEECMDLMDEGVLFYQRYVLFFQIGDYERTIRDTERNLVFFDLVSRYAEDEGDKQALEQYRPYIIRMRHAAAALLHALSENYDAALREVDTAVSLIEELPAVESGTFKFEKRRSLAILRGMAKELRRKKPPTDEELLERRLRAAVRKEQYEEAARLRDQLAKLRDASRPKSEPAKGERSA